MTKHLFTLVATMIVLAGVSAQDPPSKKEGPLPFAVVHFKSNTSSRVTILHEEIHLVTKYGKLTIPLKDVWEIRFGLHFPYPEMEKEIHNWIYRLGDDKLFKERENAKNSLVGLGYLAYPYVKRAIGSEVPERSIRAAAVAKRIEEKCSPQLLKLKEYDEVVCKDDILKGRVWIEDKEVKKLVNYFRARSEDIVNDDDTPVLHRIKFHKITALYVNAQDREQKFDLDSSKYSEQWFQTDVVVREVDRLTVRAEGQIDLWPQGLGQYMTGPKGYSTAGRNSTYMAGVLLGKVGDQGKVFVIGEFYDGQPQQLGRLQVSIVASPWNNMSSGSYKVTVRASHQLQN